MNAVIGTLGRNSASSATALHGQASALEHDRGLFELVRTDAMMMNDDRIAIALNELHDDPTSLVHLSMCVMNERGC